VTSSPSFTLPESLYRRPLALTVVASHAGYDNGQAALSVTTSVRPGTWGAIPAPKIRGRARVGATLKVRAAKVSPKPGLKYQWFRDGRAIPGANDRTYRLTGADAGHRMHVFVRYSRPHFARVGLASRSTGPVRG